ncbi:lysophospholipid acyltransferase family protein [Desulfovibrio litoralis]|uniref:1-acyl-sn-glycerol-3-phosphate acyltransferase n=1 Tax=Desulfovibrio litoralis DSM 11393 TaxID=1121455 RepID=A0A1M7SXG6_9BACT|nr:lysophospholipid acyltransferase family protein [Desulfovibrio litoralis]SHN63064.1 1-acyl-sn-glycerol-3-phosphate acyltransferase [Desulfovibrio litoralis DSM 11393]
MDNSSNDIVDFTNNYISPNYQAVGLTRQFPSLCFYKELLFEFIRAGIKARGGKYTPADWVKSSKKILKYLEVVGVKISIDGIENILQTKGPCVFVGNHMSSLETFILPGIVQPFKDTTFVVKKSLLKVPCLGNVLKARNPIALDRTNPREDLVKVLEEGTASLQSGRSVIVFPQSKRSLALDEKQFNSIGVKLAKRAGVPVIPLALRTDAWGMSSSFIKDFGVINPNLPVYFSFGKALYIEEGNGKKEQEELISFIRAKLQSWNI